MVTFIRIICTAFVFLVAWLITIFAAGVIAGERPWLVNTLLAGGILAGLYGAWRVFSHPAWNDPRSWRDN